MAETPSGMLNSIGLQGPGVEAFVEKDLAWLRQRGARAVVSIAGQQRRRVRPPRDPPAGGRRHLGHRGQHLLPERRGPRTGLRLRPRGCCGRGPRRAPRDAAGRARSSPSCRPDVTDIVEVARSVVDAGADGLSLINTLLGMVIDPDDHATGARRRHRWAVRAGDPAGGRALRVAGARGACPRCRSWGWAVSAPGSTRWSSSSPEPPPCRWARSIFNDPAAPARISAELDVALAERGFARLSDAVGHAHRPADVVPGARPVSPPGAEDTAESAGAEG